MIALTGQVVDACRLRQITIVDGLLDLEEERGVPGVQPRDRVIRLHSLRERIHVLVVNLLQ